jgi:hypothetical protein
LQLLAFSAEDVSYTVNIRGSASTPLFQANQVGAILGFEDIEQALEDFDDSDKVLITITGPGRRRQETLFITNHGLSRLSFRSSKPIARAFQMWASQVAMDIYAERQSKRKQKMKVRYEFGDTVYVVRNDGPYLKVGSTQNMNTRRDSYVAHGAHTEILFTIRCNKCTVLEAAVHNMLRAFAIPDRPDWFDVDFELVRDTIILAHAIIDKTALVALEDKESFRNLLKVYNDVASQQHIPEPSEPEPPRSELAAAPPPRDVIPPPPPQTREINVSQVVVPERNDATDYARFFEECFEIDPDSKTSTLLVQARYRAWSRSTRANYIPALEYLAGRGFSKGKVYDPDLKMTTLVMQGIRMKPVPMLENLMNPQTDVERFIHDDCSVVLTGRVGSKDIQAAFTEWKQRTGNSNYELTKEDKQDLMKFLDAHFMRAIVHNGTRTKGGFYGLCLKGTEHIGTHNKKSRRKVVYEYDPVTKAILNTYESCRDAAEALGTTEANVSIACNNQRMLHGKCLAYAVSNV